MLSRENWTHKLLKMSNLEKNIQFSPRAMKEVERIIGQFPQGKQKSAILRILHLAQEEFGGWLSTPVMDYVASLLEIQPIEVYEVATFYSMYHLEPKGKYVFEICQTGPCCAEGAEKIIHYIERKLGVEVGGTTPDGLFSLKTVECLGACGYAPMLQLGEFFHEKLTEEKIDRLIEDCKMDKIEIGTWHTELV